MDKINLSGPIYCLIIQIEKYEEEMNYLNFEGESYKFVEKLIQNYRIAIDILKKAGR